MRHTLFHLIAFPILAVLSACGMPDRHVRRNVTASEIEGEWTLTASSLELLARDGYTPPAGQLHRMTLLSGGRVSFASLVALTETGKYQETGGTWSLTQNSSHRPASDFNNYIRIDLESHVITGFGVAEEKGALILWSYYGDPDLFEFLEYERDDS